MHVAARVAEAVLTGRQAFPGQIVPDAHTRGDTLGELLRMCVVMELRFRMRIGMPTLSWSLAKQGSQE